jgi:hypothetical protein
MGNPNKSHRYTGKYLYLKVIKSLRIKVFNLNSILVQCVLPINLFNQQVFTIIWLWYLFVLAFNVVMFFSWLQKAVPSKARKWISKRVNLINRTMSTKKIRLEHFLGKYLEADGLFMIRMIAYKHFFLNLSFLILLHGITFNIIFYIMPGGGGGCRSYCLKI